MGGGTAPRAPAERRRLLARRMMAAKLCLNAVTLWSSLDVVSPSGGGPSTFGVAAFQLQANNPNPLHERLAGALGVSFFQQQGATPEEELYTSYMDVGKRANNYAGAGSLDQSQQNPPAGAAEQAEVEEGQAVPFPAAKKPLRDRPYVKPEECKALEGAMQNNPKPVCERVELDADTDGCKCVIRLPASIHPTPEKINGMSAIHAPAEEAPGATDVEPLAALEGPAPAVNNGAPYAPPSMTPDCPFSVECADEEECTGFNNFGFSKVLKGRYSPASRMLNTIYCMYLMPIENAFRTPARVDLLRQ